jgi:hypothetical protein
MAPASSPIRAHGFRKMKTKYNGDRREEGITLANLKCFK